jgi:TRAP-type mannitol/chloroaromatic compound transport system substrate-binding protein
MVNRDAWDGLSAEYRAAFTAACGSAAAAMIRRYDSKNPPALKRLLTQGVKLRAFPESIMEAASRAARSLYQEQAHSDAAYRRVWEHWNHFRTESSHWFSTAELAYARFAFADP